GMLDKWFDIISNAKNMHELDDARIQIIGKNGELTKEFSKLASIANDKKRDFAQNLNVQKNQVSTAINNQKTILEKQEEKLSLLNDAIDVSLYSKHKNSGSLHPIMETMDYIIEYFASMNFDIKYGPYVEDDFHNFEALNLPKYHPARDMQDTFYFKDKNLLRTHTSPVQIRTMLKESAPIKMISPGAVFR
ncbi:phenylalanine--tRNA ligase subunit alpha, partial [Methylococcaceae bacterium HT3]